MNAVVLAAGEGTELHPLTDNKPTARIEADGPPLIEDVFDNIIALDIDDDFALLLGDNVFRANLPDVLSRQREDRADAASSSRRSHWRRSPGMGVFRTNEFGEIVELVEPPDEPPSNLVMTGCYTFPPAIFHAGHPVQPSDRGESELPDAVDLLLQSGRTIDTSRIEGWRNCVGYPEDREMAERRLRADADTSTAQ